MFLRTVPVMPEDTRRHLGAAGEQLAAEHLQRRGYAIVERNFRTRWGELDIVACDGRTLVFCEVKARREARGGTADPLESVRRGKRNQVRKMAGRWLIERIDRPRVDELRFDAIGVTFDQAGRLVRLDHVEGAF
jgi:putative endonuclease